MSFDLKRELAHNVWDEIQPLLDEHWREIAHFDDILLKPKKHIYLVLEERNALRVITCRDEGRLIGYAVFLVDTHMHYEDSLQATQDVLFLLPEYRNTGNGAALLTFCDMLLKSEGVQCVLQHVKLAHDFGPLLTALGYHPVETMYVKRLDT